MAATILSVWHALIYVTLIYRKLSKVTQLGSAELRFELRQAGSEVSALNPCTILPLSCFANLICLKLSFLFYEMGTLVPTLFRKLEDKTRAQMCGKPLDPEPCTGGI